MRRVMKRSDAGISWMYEAKLADLDFADSIALLEESVYSMQHSTSVLEEEASRVGLCINPNKCVEWDSRHPLPRLYSGLEVVDEFCYLGSYISQNGNCEKDVKVRIGKASAIFGKIKKVWRSKHINLLTKLRLYKALILSDSPLCRGMASYRHIEQETAGSSTPQVVERTKLQMKTCGKEQIRYFLRR